MTSAAGLAMGGLHPVVAVYATFINRAFDQVLLDVALHRCGVTFVLDRAGVTGDDGASHNGMWDMSLLQIVPGLRLAAPRDGAQLRELLREAVDVDDAPTVVRFAKGAVCEDLPALERVGIYDILSRDTAQDVLVIAVGAFGHLGADAADLIRAQGHGVTVVDPRWVKPVDPALVELTGQFGLVVTLEDTDVRAGWAPPSPRPYAMPPSALPSGCSVSSRSSWTTPSATSSLGRLGLTPQAVADDALAALARNSTDG